MSTHIPEPKELQKRVNHELREAFWGPGNGTDYTRVSSHKGDIYSFLGILAPFQYWKSAPLYLIAKHIRGIK